MFLKTTVIKYLKNISLIKLLQRQLGVVLHSYNSTTLEAEAGGLKVRGHLGAVVLDVNLGDEGGGRSVEARKVLMSDDSAEMLSQGESLHRERKCKLERLLDTRYSYTTVKRNY